MSNQNLYPASSPYNETNVVNNLFLDVMQPRDIPALSTDTFITLNATYEYRPDLLAYDLYNDSRLWWVFAARNPNLLGPDPYFNFVSGVGIYVPSIETLRNALGI